MEDECTPGQRAWAPVLTPLTLDWPHWWWGSQSRSFTPLIPLEAEGAQLWQEGEHQLKTLHWGCHLPQTGHHCSWGVLSYLVLFGEKADESLIFLFYFFKSRQTICPQICFGKKKEKKNVLPTPLCWHVLWAGYPVNSQGRDHVFFYCWEVPRATGLATFRSSKC